MTADAGRSFHVLLKSELYPGLLRICTSTLGVLTFCLFGILYVLHSIDQ